jgi:hypothetical protein
MLNKNRVEAASILMIFSNGKSITIQQKPLLVTAIALVILICASPLTVSALQKLSVPIQIASPNSQSQGFFGYSVSVGEGRVVSGAPQERGGPTGILHQAGNVYVFDAENGDLLLTLTSPNAQVDGEFGYSVGVGGGLIIVGAPFETASGQPAAGNAYIFKADSGTLLFSLSSPAPVFGGFFGYSVHLGEGLVAVGAPHETVAGLTHAGSAYLFNAETGGLTSALSSPNPETEGFFGGTIAIGDGQVAIGAPGETASGQTEAGNAYLFDAHQGTLEFSLTTPNPVSFGNFGYSVDLDNGNVVIGAPRETASGQTTAGNAYLYESNNGRLVFTLINPNPENGGFFGGTVSIGNGVLAVGATDQTIVGQKEAGAAYVFDTNKGEDLSSLTSPNPLPFRNFGFSISVDGGHVVLGAPREGPGGGRAGNAYIF